MKVFVIEWAKRKNFITMSEFIQSQAGTLKDKREELREKGCAKYYLHCYEADILVMQLFCNATKHM